MNSGPSKAPFLLLHSNRSGIYLSIHTTPLRAPCQHYYGAGYYSRIPPRLYICLETLKILLHRPLTYLLKYGRSPPAVYLAEGGKTTPKFDLVPNSCSKLYQDRDVKWESLLETMANGTPCSLTTSFTHFLANLTKESSYWFGRNVPSL